jgi:hypothetical protein
MMVLLGGLAFYLGWAGALRQEAGALSPGSPIPRPSSFSADGFEEAPPDPGPLPESAPERSEEEPSPDSSPDSPLAGGDSAAPRALASIVIDDCGQHYERERGFLELEAPLTLAVLPHLPDSQRVAGEATGRGRGVLLHMPMESAGGGDPGPGALRADMGDDELADRVRENFLAVPGVCGINNHQGSQGTTDPRVVRAVLQEAARQGVFVLDSRTTPTTILAQEAQAMGLRTRSRDLFLDHEDDVDRILLEIDRLGELALRHGTAVALAHPRPATLQALRVGLPRLREAGVTLVGLQELVESAPVGGAPEP